MTPRQAARLHRFAFPGLALSRWCVLVAGTAERAAPEALTLPGTVTALLTHDEGARWPDPAGEALMRTTVAAGGVACLAFARCADALAALRRVQAEAAHG